MRSKKLLVGEESQEDFDRLAAGWRAEYEPEGQAAESVIERVILGDWFLRRAERCCMEAEWELAEVEGRDHKQEELDAKHAKVQLYSRYRTTHERSFYRAFYALRGLRKDKVKELLDVKRFEEKLNGMAEQAVKDAAERGTQKAQNVAAAQREKKVQQKRKKHGGKPVVIEQWVEVEVENGRAETKVYPSNEELKKKAETMDADLVYRRINFPQGVPPEYAWVAPPDDVERRERGGMGVQRMTLDTWLQVIEREAARGTGHIGPTGVGNLPRPMERGGCDCRVCRENRELLERRAA